jgi:hypothetical protein
MGAFELTLVIGLVWIAAIAIFVSIAAVASRADSDHDSLVTVASGAPVHAVLPAAPAESRKSRSRSSVPMRA